MIPLDHLNLLLRTPAHLPQLLLRLPIQVRRHRHRHVGNEIALTILTQPRHALALDTNLLARLGPRSHIERNLLATQILLVGGDVTHLSAPRIATRNTHGTGCTLSAAMAALRPQRDGWAEATRDAKDYLTQALAASERLDVGAGTGHGPVHHFHAWW